MRNLNTKQCLIRLLKSNCVLAFHTVIRCYEESFDSFTGEFLYFLFEVIFYLLQLNIAKVLALFISFVKVGVLCFDSKQPSIYLVPKNLDRYSIRADFKL